MVCDAHRPDGPGSDRLKRGLRAMAEANLANYPGLKERIAERQALGRVKHRHVLEAT
jgi:hypothetical protein